ncbi:hypothetical protein [Clostridium polynesiense]|uniref:hypothetical protein n=1 Tax=Clostridium polynesiense TaxID=1325933 RepID=UPI0011C96237|nr:hypothetical protein [Clostridium polynesiense]
MEEVSEGLGEEDKSRAEINNTIPKGNNINDISNINNIPNIHQIIKSAGENLELIKELLDNIVKVGVHSSSSSKSTEAESGSTGAAESTSGSGTVVQENTLDEINDALSKSDILLRTLNSIKTELCRINLDFCEREYYTNCILPLLSILNQLSIVSIDLASSVNILTSSCIVFRKESRLEDTIKLVYSINKKCGEIYDVLSGRIDALLYDGCCNK